MVEYFARLNTAESRETAPSVLRLGIGAGVCRRRLLLLAVCPMAQPRVILGEPCQYPISS